MSEKTGIDGAEHNGFPGMTPCRPSTPQPRCTYCQRATAPVTRTTQGGRIVDEVVIDPTAISAKPCSLYVTP